MLLLAKLSSNFLFFFFYFGLILSKRSGTPSKTKINPKPNLPGLVPIKLPVIEGYAASKSNPAKINIKPRVKYLSFIQS